LLYLKREIKMPLPMVHFAVSVAIAKQLSRPLTAEFLLGAIAPDAIHMRPGTNRLDKDHTHLLRAPHAEIADADYVGTVRCFVMKQRQSIWASVEFIEGYAAHLLTDRFWVNTVYRSFREQTPGELSPEERTKLYYQETDQVDLLLYDQMEWRQQVWALLETAQAFDFAPLLSAAEIHGYKEQKMAWYTAPARQRGLQPKFITYAQVIEFVPQAADWSLHCLRESPKK
jgi:hypothetical protein